MLGITQFYLHSHTFIHEWNEPHLPLLSQPCSLVIVSIVWVVYYTITGAFWLDWRQMRLWKVWSWIWAVMHWDRLGVKCWRTALLIYIASLHSTFLTTVCLFTFDKLFDISASTVFIFRLHRMHEVLSITSVRGGLSVSLSVTRLKSAAARAVFTTCRVCGVIWCSFRQMPLASC